VVAGQHGKRNFYARFHSTPSGDLLGFSYAYPTVEAARLGRIATILSNSFEIDMAAANQRPGSPTADTSSLTLASGEFWVIVASRIDLSEAIDVARGFAANFPNTFVAEASNGRYAIVVGRVEGEKWQSIKHDGISSGLLPADTFATRGEKLRSVLWEAPATPPTASTQPVYSPPASPPPAVAETPPAKRGISAGTGFLITTSGHVLTNAHVVEGCTSAEVGSAGMGAVIAADERNDLAMVKLLTPPSGVEPVTFAREGAPLAATVAALGYPLPDMLGPGLNFTMGNVSSLVGLGGDTSRLQMTAAVQPGNSGGPLVNDRGQVVGVVVAKLDALKVAVATGDIPQSVSFAIRTEAARAFLAAHGVAVATAGSEAPAMPMEAIAAKVGPATKPIRCQPQ
jgi:S1-C subfamily serine protease